MPLAELPWLQAAALMLAGLVTLNRRVLVAFALVVFGAGLAVGVPARPLERPWIEVAIELAPLLAAFAIGLAVATARVRRANRSPRVARPVGTGRGATVAAAIVTAAVLAAVTTGLYVDGRLAPSWRATVDGWIASPAFRRLAGAVGIEVPQAAPPPARAAAKPAPAGAAAPRPATAAVPGRVVSPTVAAPAKADAAAPSTAGPAGSGVPAAASASAPAAASAAAAPARAPSRAVSRPAGDLRDCLQRGSTLDIVRCAERS